jgi:Protein of unknown function (DUF429)
MLPPSGSVLGIDVGWSLKQRSSAICRLDWTESNIGWTVRHFTAEPTIRREAAASVAGSHRLLAAALDGPLRGDLDVIDRYRAAERALTHRQISSRISQPGSSRSPVGRLLNHHTNEFARLLLDHADISDAKHQHAIHSKAIVEAFPTSFLGLMLDSPEKGLRQKRSDRYFEAALHAGLLHLIIAECLPGRQIEHDLSRLTHHDDRAAFVCALTALLVAADDYTAVGDKDGWIILPPLRFIARWAQPVVEGWNNCNNVQL